MGSRSKNAEVEVLVESRVLEGARVGRVVDFIRGRVRVDYEGNPGGPLSARVSATLDDAALAAAARDNQEALLVFERADPSRPVLMALLRSEKPLLDVLLAGELPTEDKIVRVEERRVLIQGEEEIVLQCGKASLTLRRDGKVVLRGVNLVTQAEQVNKIRGGKVQIN
jgi:hypothetical protein